MNFKFLFCIGMLMMCLAVASTQKSRGRIQKATKKIQQSSNNFGKGVWTKGPKTQSQKKSTFKKIATNVLQTTIGATATAGAFVAIDKLSDNEDAMNEFEFYMETTGGVLKYEFLLELMDRYQDKSTNVWWYVGGGSTLSVIIAAIIGYIRIKIKKSVMAGIRA